MPATSCQGLREGGWDMYVNTGVAMTTINSRPMQIPNRHDVNKHG
jgi:hypothetical protein